MVVKILEWIYENVKWIFSGVGNPFFYKVYKVLRKIFDKKKKENFELNQVSMIKEKNKWLSDKDIENWKNLYSFFYTSGLLKKVYNFNFGVSYSEDYFYELRSLDRSEDYDNMTDVEKAGRVIYLNKTCFNGLFRVNRAGFFNTPYGKYKNPSIVDEVTIKAVSNYFNSANIKFLTGDYKEALKRLRRGAFVYFDPPYMPISSSSSFTGYTEHGFDYEKQVELRDECLKLHNRGVRFLQSNSYSPEILELYSDQKVFNIEIVQAKRSINSQADKRGEISEVLIYNYEKE